MINAKYIITTWALLFVLVEGINNKGLPGVAKELGACLYCQVAVIDIMLGDGLHEQKYRCITDDTQEGDHESEMAYDLTLPSNFIKVNKARLDSGMSSICIIGGSAVRTEFGHADFVIVPLHPVIHFVVSRARRERRLLETTGTRSVLVVRVTAASGVQALSAADMADSAFGSAGQVYSMAAQYKSCSVGKLNLVPATSAAYPTKVINGVLDIALTESVEKTNVFTLENPLKNMVKAALGITDLSTTFAHIMFCMPSGTKYGRTKSWVAWAYVPGQISFYNNEWCQSLSAQMHELGHNLGLHHSNEQRIQYGDQSCLMGYSYLNTGFPRMCFNGHKNYVLGWYADKQISVDPSVTGAWSGKLVGFVDYEKAATSRGEYVLIIVGNYYVQFNLAEGFNAETKEKGNMITIVTAPEADAASSMVSGLLATNLTTLGSYTIEVCAMVQATATNPKYMLMSIRLTTSQSSSCPTLT